MPAAVRDKATGIAQRSAENLRRAREAGVRFVAGSAAGTPFNHHNQFGRELELMQIVLGMSPAEALRAATADAAALLGVDRAPVGTGRSQLLVCTICKSGWTKTVRPPTSLTNKIKLQIDRAYGLPTNTRGELDHHVSLELGGAPDDLRNLWVEPGTPWRTSSTTR